MSTSLLPWLIAAGLVLVWLFSCVSAWSDNRYEVTAVSSWRFRLTRRWYSIRSRVRCGDRGEVYEVRDWSDDGTAVPWLLVANFNGDPDDVYWCPVTDCTPSAVRRFRPRLLVVRYGRIPVPWLFLFWYEPAPRQCKYCGEPATCEHDSAISHGGCLCDAHLLAADRVRTREQGAS